jgi:hypothetical protein
VSSSVDVVDDVDDDVVKKPGVTAPAPPRGFLP